MKAQDDVSFLIDPLPVRPGTSAALTATNDRRDRPSAIGSRARESGRIDPAPRRAIGISALFCDARGNAGTRMVGVAREVPPGWTAFARSDDVDADVVPPCWKRGRCSARRSAASDGGGHSDADLSALDSRADSRAAVRITSRLPKSRGRQPRAPPEGTIITRSGPLLSS